MGGGGRWIDTLVYCAMESDSSMKNLICFSLTYSFVTKTRYHEEKGKQPTSFRRAPVAQEVDGVN